MNPEYEQKIITSQTLLVLIKAMTNNFCIVFSIFFKVKHKNEVLFVFTLFFDSFSLYLITEWYTYAIP